MVSSDKNFEVFVPEERGNNPTHIAITEFERSESKDLNNDISKGMENESVSYSEDDSVYHNESQASSFDVNSYISEGNELEVPKHNMNNRQDSFSVTSVSSASSSSSSLSSIGLSLESVKKLNSLAEDQKVIKSFGPSSSSSNFKDNRTPSVIHHRIRRVPSTANPKYRIPNLQKNQRSVSQPFVHSNNLQNHKRRNSSPSNLNCKGTPSNHTKSIKQTSSMPNFSNVNQPQLHQPQDSKIHNQQQIIYLQIPQPSESQLSDPYSLQQQISSQLQLLVPQIYSQLVNQISSNTRGLKTVNVSLNQNNSTESNPETNFKHINKTLEPGYALDQTQSIINQMLQQSIANMHSSNHQPSSSLKIHNSNDKNLTLGNLNESDTIINGLDNFDLSQILKQIPPERLEQTHKSSEISYIEIQKLPETSKIIIPVSEELILQCQQLQQFKESNFTPYQPKLETILEESLSVKHLKPDRFSKTKIIACILTVLCVVIVILLAGDKTAAIAVITAFFVLFLLGATFFLYTHSSKGEIDNTLPRTESVRVQVSAMAKRSGGPSLV